MGALAAQQRQSNADPPPKAKSEPGSQPPFQRYPPRQPPSSQADAEQDTRPEVSQDSTVSPLPRTQADLADQTIVVPPTQADTEAQED